MPFNAFTEFAIRSAMVMPEIAPFEKLAFAVTLQNWEAWRDQTKQEEQSKSQTLIETRHTDKPPSHDNYPHSNRSHTDRPPHYDYSDTPHSNTPSKNKKNHTNTGHSQSGHTNHSNGPGHYQSTGGHTNAYYKGHNETAPGGTHFNVYDRHSNHNDRNAHADKLWTHANNHAQSPHSNNYSQHTQHSNYSHSNYPGDDSHSQRTYHSQTPHSNSPSHNQSIPHSNSGVDHANYVPSRPAFYPLDGELTGSVLVGLYSYDKNKDGYGTQLTVSKEVFYDLQIRKIKRGDGAPQVTNWITLASGVKEQSGGGLQIPLNTLDPLKSGNVDPQVAEGWYELKAVARNQPYAGKTYVSPEQIITIQIKHNEKPEVLVSNGSEFISFTFGFDGVLTPTNVYKEYDEGLYADIENQHVLAIRVRMSDLDEDNWQKGVVYLRTASGQVVPGTTANIIWENGDTIIRSAGETKNGLAVINKEKFLTSDQKNMQVVVEIRDYRDAACSEPTGTVVTLTTVSATNPTKLEIHVDVTPPEVAASALPSPDWMNTNVPVNLIFTDAVSGLQIKQYALTSSPSVPTNWSEFAGSVTIQNEGYSYLHYRAVDRLQNERIGYFGPYKIDKTAPVLMFKEEPTQAGTRIHVTATDNFSGVKRIRLPNGTWVTGSTATYNVTTDGTYNFIVEDHAGNSRTVPYVVTLQPEVKELTLVDIVKPPLGTTAPVHYPVSEPTRIKAGYNMSFSMKVFRTERVEIRVLADGRPITVFEDGVERSVITKNTGTLGDTFVNFNFWLDKDLPKGKTISLRITVTRQRADGTSVEVVETNLGHNFGVVVGSSKEDGDVNIGK